MPQNISAYWASDPTSSFLIPSRGIQFSCGKTRWLKLWLFYERRTYPHVDITIKWTTDRSLYHTVAIVHYSQHVGITVHVFRAEDSNK